MVTLKHTLIDTADATIAAMAGGAVSLAALAMYQGVLLVSYGKGIVIACVLLGGLTMGIGMLISCAATCFAEAECRRLEQEEREQQP